MSRTTRRDSGEEICRSAGNVSDAVQRLKCPQHGCRYEGGVHKRRRSLDSNADEPTSQLSNLFDSYHICSVNDGPSSSNLVGSTTDWGVFCTWDCQHIRRTTAGTFSTCKRGVMDIKGSGSDPKRLVLNANSSGIASFVVVYSESQPREVTG